MQRSSKPSVWQEHLNEWLHRPGSSCLTNDVEISLSFVSLTMASAKPLCTRRFSKTFSVQSSIRSEVSLVYAKGMQSWITLTITVYRQAKTQTKFKECALEHLLAIYFLYISYCLPPCWALDHHHRQREQMGRTACYSTLQMNPLCKEIHCGTRFLGDVKHLVMTSLMIPGASAPHFAKRRQQPGKLALSCTPKFESRNMTVLYGNRWASLLRVNLWGPTYAACHCACWTLQRFLGFVSSLLWCRFSKGSNCTTSP